ncbi:hypothetical protein GF359_04180 [candidate division WOR-3 bacterium]|uniref:DUF7793 domain-containing protein n=1 Tax=candidate division WOR-3 bacterium TaxID=2052148 RepID=A0A9D5K8N9_UNCW3|nr:hypothetical protein [candidate division WOR-3 bacterium]MBD3364396.1 hypothetical protein [candidate division WOR-3 bacterium]
MIPETRFDKDKGAVVIKFTEVWAEKDIPVLFSKLRELLEDKPRRLLIADVSEAAPQKYSKEFRRLVGEETPTLKLEKTAILGANPVVRMMAKVLMAAMKKKIPFNAEFFKKEKNAVEWLKQD